MEAIPTAVFGLGYAGSSRANIITDVNLPLHKWYKLVAICDTDEKRLTSYSPKVGGVKKYLDPIALLELQKDVKVVIVSVPATGHRKIAERAIEKGYHVFLEKPMTASGEDAEYLFKLANDYGITLFTGWSEVNNPAIRKLKEPDVIPSWDCVVSGHETRIGPGRIDMDVGIIRDLVGHFISEIYFWTDSLPKIDRIDYHSKRKKWREIKFDVQGVPMTMEIDYRSVRVRDLTLDVEIPSQKKDSDEIEEVSGFYLLQHGSQELTLFRSRTQNQNENTAVAGSLDPFLRRYRMIDDPIYIEKRQPWHVDLEKFRQSIEEGRAAEPVCSGEKSVEIAKLLDELEETDSRNKILVS